MRPKVIHLCSEEINNLRRQFLELDEVSDFERNIKLASKVAAYGIYREVGTVNDELARFIFNVNTARPVSVESLKAELIEWNGLFGLRVFSTDSQFLELRTKGLYDMVHPQLSRNSDGSLHSLFIFPEIIQKIVQAEGVSLVLVKSWGMNSIFGSFDTTKGYYQTNFWEIENNDVIKFSDQVRKGKIALLGTHDLVAHIAGIDRIYWSHLRIIAERVFNSIDSYFSSTNKPSISALILPYTIGVVLDDLAQPPSYSSKSHIAVLEMLIDKLSKNQIPANLPTILTQFPESFQKIIELSRTPNIEEKPDEIHLAISDLVTDILKHSLSY